RVHPSCDGRRPSPRRRLRPRRALGRGSGALRRADVARDQPAGRPLAPPRRGRLLAPRPRRRAGDGRARARRGRGDADGRRLAPRGARAAPPDLRTPGRARPRGVSEPPRARALGLAGATGRAAPLAGERPVLFRPLTMDDGPRVARRGPWSIVLPPQPSGLRPRRGSSHSSITFASDTLGSISRRKAASASTTVFAARSTAAS